MEMYMMGFWIEITALTLFLAVSLNPKRRRFFVGKKDKN
tara:strand:+ start:1025 stop:1141 length:117 start_codon:yes stop_codon:yes gene_type:complete